MVVKFKCAFDKAATIWKNNEVATGKSTNRKAIVGPMNFFKKNNHIVTF